MGLNGPLREQSLEALRTRRAVCADCRFSEIFAVQPRAICWRPDAKNYRRVLDSWQPACDDVVVRRGDDLSLHSFDLHVPLLAAYPIREAPVVPISPSKPSVSSSAGFAPRRTKIARAS